MNLAQRIHGASPFGPIFGKELRIASRRKRNHFLRVCYLGGLLLFLLMVYAGSAGNTSRAGNVAYRMQMQAELGQSFFIAFSLFCVGCMGLISPILTSTAISSERLGNTLTVLLMTPITSWQIVAGKLFSRLLIALMLIGLSLPVLAVVRLLGAIEVWEMVAVLALSTSFALATAALGLFYSSLLNRAYAVILLSYATMFVIYFVAPLLASMLLFSSSRTMSPFWYGTLIPAANAPFNVAIICIPDLNLLRTTTIWGWMPCVLTHLGMTLMLLTATSWIVRRHGRREGPRAILVPAAAPSPIVDAPPTIEPLAVPPALPVSPAADVASRPVGNNPVLWRELRRPLVAGRFSRLAGALVVVVLLLSYMAFQANRALDEEELQIGYAVIFNGLFWLFTAVLAATAIAQEKESDTWTLLLTAPLSARSIVIGKLMGIARRMTWPLVLIAAHFALFTLTDVISMMQFVLFLWVIVSFNCLWAATGLYLSLRMKKVTTAVIINLMIAIVLYAAVPVLMLTLGMLLARSEEPVEATGIYIPYVYLVSIGDSNWRGPGGAWFPILGRIHTVAFVMLTAGVGLIHVILAVSVVRKTIGTFNRLVGRAEQALPIT